MPTDDYRVLFSPASGTRVTVEILNLDPILGDLRIPLPSDLGHRRPRFEFSKVCRGINDARMYAIGVISYRRQFLHPDAATRPPARIWYGDRLMIDDRKCHCRHSGSAHRAGVGPCLICETEDVPIFTTCTTFAAED